MRTAAIVLAVLAVAGCSTAPEPAPTPTGYVRGVVVDQKAYDAMRPFAHDTAEIDDFIDAVCMAAEDPQQLIDAVHADAVLVRLAVLAGCPDRKDWTS